MSNPQPQPKQHSSVGFYLPQFFVWLCILLLSAYLFATLSLNEQEVKFNQQSSAALSRIKEQIVINDTALSGLANLLQASNLNDTSSVQRYADYMRKAYDQIYMFEVLMGIDPNEQLNFAKHMQSKGFPDYKVYRYIAKSNKTGKPSKPFNMFNETPVMFPIFFIAPNPDDVKSVLGFDMMSTKLFREPLSKALTTGKTSASSPYNLQEGGKGYFLFKPVKATQNPSGADAVGTLVATVLVLTQPMLEAVHAAIPGAHIRLTHGENLKLAAESILPIDSRAPVLQLGELTRVYKLDRYGQPFTVEIKQSVGFYASQLNQLIVIVLVLLLGYFIYLRTSMAKHRSEVQRDQALISLAQQHDQLEDMVAKRTAELQQSSDENRRLAKQIIRIQEDQYHHLARELHDEFGQTLTAIKISAHIIAQNDDTEVVHRCADDIFQHSESLYENIRHLIQRLRPEALDMFGLSMAIAQCASEFKFIEQNIDVELDIDDSVDGLDETFTLATYRIIQELLNNTAKYAQATKVTVQAHEEPEGLCICVIDDGIGFDKESLGKGHGFNGISERVKTLGGSMDIQSAPGEGVKICVKLPASFPA
mgnify:CR=1 FL=1